MPENSYRKDSRYLVRWVPRSAAEIEDIHSVIEELKNISIGVAAGVEPGVAAGVEPGVAAGVEPGVTAGVEPGVAAGVEPGVAAGVEPVVPAGVEPVVPAGVEPGVPDGDIAVNIGHNLNNLGLFVDPHSTFAELKNVIANETGLKPQDQKLLFRGKEMDDHEHLHTAGVKNNAKIILIENLPTKCEDLVDKTEKVNKTVEEATETVKEVLRGVEAVNKIRDEDDHYAGQVASLDVVVCSGTQVADTDFVFLTEMLMIQLLKLDGIEAEGEGRTLRKSEVRRVQGLMDTLDNLRTKNADGPKTASGEPLLPSL